MTADYSPCRFQPPPCFDARSAAPCRVEGDFAEEVFSTGGDEDGRHIGMHGAGGTVLALEGWLGELSPRPSSPYSGRRQRLRVEQREQMGSAGSLRPRASQLPMQSSFTSTQNPIFFFKIPYDIKFLNACMKC